MEFIFFSFGRDHFHCCVRPWSIWPKPVVKTQTYCASFLFFFRFPRPDSRWRARKKPLDSHELASTCDTCTGRGVSPPIECCDYFVQFSRPKRKKNTCNLDSKNTFKKNKKNVAVSPEPYTINSDKIPILHHRPTFERIFCLFLPSVDFQLFLFQSK